MKATQFYSIMEQSDTRRVPFAFYLLLKTPNKVIGTSFRFDDGAHNLIHLAMLAYDEFVVQITIDKDEEEMYWVHGTYQEVVQFLEKIGVDLDDLSLWSDELVQVGLTVHTRQLLKEDIQRTGRRFR